ncbi:MAG: DUF3185 family protein [Puniceicoccaceae bacterium]|nr:MAG: DUF3185 family protein [Puniceicoccaceae bacterium]
MHKGISIALLIVGVILLVFGFQAADSFQSEVSEAFTGTPSDRSMWFFITGVIALCAGAGGLFMARGK